MRDVKPKQDEYMEGSVPSSRTASGSLKKKKAEPVYPRVRLDLETVPEAKKWEVGETYRLEMEVKMVGLSISKYDNSADFEIHKIGSEEGGENE